MTNQQRLGDQAREAVAQRKFNGHKTRRDAELAACAAEIEAIKRTLHDNVMRAATAGQETANLGEIRSFCLGSASSKYQDPPIVCPQCRDFMKWLKAEGFEPYLDEDTRGRYAIGISWKEKE